MNIIKHFVDKKSHVFLDGIKLYAEVNPIVGRSFKLSCDIQTTVISTITIGAPDDIIVGSCSSASPPFPADCVAAVGYDASLNGRIVTISISSLASDVNGTWTCTHNSITGTWSLPTIPGNFNVHVQLSLLHTCCMKILCSPYYNTFYMNDSKWLQG